MAENINGTVVLEAGDIADRLEGGLPSGRESERASEQQQLTSEEQAATAKAEREAAAAEDKKWRDDMAARLRQTEMELQYHRGRANSQQQQITQAPVVEQEPIYDLEAIRRDFADPERAPQALVDLVKRIRTDGETKLLKQVDERISGRLTETQREAQIRAAFVKEVNDVVQDVGELWQNEQFKEEANQETLRILSLRGGTFDPANPFRGFQPGDLNAAAMRVYVQWIKAGKVRLDNTQPQEQQSTNGRPLREIVRSIPRDSGLGNGQRVTNSAPKTIDELYKDDGSRRDAKAVLNRLKAHNPGLTEQLFVQNYLEAANENNNYA